MLATTRAGQVKYLQGLTRRTLFSQPTSFIRRQPGATSRSFLTIRNNLRPAWRTAYRDFAACFRSIRYNGTKPSPRPNPTPHLGSPQPTGLKARFQELSRKYGWVAVGVYFALSALDLPLCFLAVRLAGPERIGQIEDSILTTIKPYTAPFTSALAPILQPIKDFFKRKDKAAAAEEVAETEKEHSQAASIWTELAIAYGIHKTLLIFVRVPLAAALTPKVAKTLRSWGWQVGRKKTT